MIADAPAHTDIFLWFDTLNEDEQADVLRALRKVANDLGTAIDRKPLIMHKLLDLAPHNQTVISLN